MVKRYPYLFLVVLVLAMLSLVVACADPHVHTYADELTNDNDYHWYAATCEHTDEVSDKALHTWDEGVVTTPAQPGIEGVKTYTCTACGKKEQDLLMLLLCHQVL